MRTVANAKLFDSYSNSEKELISKINFITGFEDEETTAMLIKARKNMIEEDETIALLFAENSTAQWNPLIFAIFYQQIDLVQYVLENYDVQLRTSLLMPFSVEESEAYETPGEAMSTAGAPTEYMFLQQKSQIMPLYLTIMHRNIELFEMIWEECSFFWNDTHLLVVID